MYEMVECLCIGGLMCVFLEGMMFDGQELLLFYVNLFQVVVLVGCVVQLICLMYEDVSG